MHKGQRAQIWLGYVLQLISRGLPQAVHGVQIGLHRNADGSIDTSKFKIVYVAPMKALVAEMVGNFSARLEP